MKKALIFLLSSTLILSACGNDDEKPSKDNKPKEETKKTKEDKNKKPHLRKIKLKSNLLSLILLNSPQ